MGDSINVWPLLTGETHVSPRKQVEIGTNAGGMKNDKEGMSMMGGLIVRVHDKLYKILIGDADGKIECDERFGPSHGSKLMGILVEGNLTDTHDAGCSEKALRTCGVTPESGCLFNLHADPMESTNLANQEPALFSELLAQVRQVNETAYRPDRGKFKMWSCTV